MSATVGGYQGRFRHDDGSVMMLVIGLVPVLFLIVAVGVDAAVLFIHRRALASTADAAALAGAQAGDLDRIYNGRRRLADLPLDCPAARRAVHDQVVPARSDSRARRSVVEAVSCDGTTVSVVLRGSADLPFSAHLGLTPTVTVRGRAAARSPLR